MATGIKKWLDRKLPQNFIIKKPLLGAIIFVVINFCFLIIYKPFNVQPANSFSFKITMLAYSLILLIPVYGSAMLIKRFLFVSGQEDWTLFKEIISILIILLVTGVAIYFVGFLIEGPSKRWNFLTFIDSFKYSFMVGIIPFVFFTLPNYRFIFYQDIEKFYNQVRCQPNQAENGELLYISSQLKKERLSFYPNQFLYAESDGNYIVFHLDVEGNHIKKTIRNSINNVEQQLCPVTFIMRVHRAFMVNLKKVSSKKGNTLGYRLKLAGLDVEIPVSRNNVRNFDQKIDQFH